MEPNFGSFNSNCTSLDFVCYSEFRNFIVHLITYTVSRRRQIINPVNLISELSAVMCKLFGVRCCL